MTPTPHCLF